MHSYHRVQPSLYRKDLSPLCESCIEDSWAEFQSFHLLHARAATLEVASPHGVQMTRREHQLLIWRWIILLICVCLCLAFSPASFSPLWLWFGHLCHTQTYNLGFVERQLLYNYGPISLGSPNQILILITWLWGPSGASYLPVYPRTGLVWLVCSQKSNLTWLHSCPIGIIMPCKQWHHLPKLYAWASHNHK